MTTLLKTILEADQIMELQPDFKVLKVVPKELANASQFLVFSSPKKHHLQALTTNNYPEKVKELINQLENKGFTLEVFYTSSEGFTYALSWYTALEEHHAREQDHALEAQKAEGKSAISLLNQLFEQREASDPWLFIKEIIRLAFQAGASDLHFQPEDEGVRIRLRLDGVLMNLMLFSHQEFWKYMQKIKFISWVKMNIDYLPQDWRFSFEASDVDGNWRKIDARINFMPGVKTESVVIRFLDASDTIDNFEQIGFNSDQIALLESYMQKTTGIIIVTWPTGSGKTTSLYAMLKKINNGKKKIITLEDPIEYKISWLQQSQINYDKGYDYETGLKAILRQDPDIILVGETRTKETANIAINAALTGHLVFTTLHTNSALDSITRLMNMGIEPYLLTPALQLVMGQRLVRKNCPHCKQWEDAHPEEDAKIRATISQIQKYKPEFWKEYQWKIVRNQGCEHCNHTGYQDRIAVVELFEITDTLREAILNGLRGKELQELAYREGFIPLQADWISKVITGETSLEEVYRVSF